jgi:hypothetical protein
LLLLSIPLNRRRVFLSVAALVVGVSLPPFLLAIANALRILRIVLDLLPVIISAPMALAIWLAADYLLRSVRRWRKELLAVTAAAGRQARLLRRIRDTSLRKSEIDGDVI